MSCLRLILGDQLSYNISSLEDTDKERDIILMAEVMEEATYVKHHKKKIILIFSAMRHFAEELKQKGFNVKYTKIDDPENSGSLLGEVKKYEYDSLVVTEPGEWRLLDEIKDWEKTLGKPVEMIADKRFISSQDEFHSWAEGRKELTMEYFYRDIRKKTGLLMDENGKPEGGKWNYDKENRKSLPKGIEIKGPKHFEPDKVTSEIIDVINERFSNHFGDSEPFWFGVTAAQAEEALNHFVEHNLQYFGDYQDAMLSDEAFLFHSIISIYINCGLLDPIEACQKVEQAYKDGKAPLNAVEGFIRQIIGWREFIRGVYWRYMPEYTQRNYLETNKKLPDFFWTGKTDMHCMSQVINMTKKEAYSHHIQRLMVTGNFSLLAGFDVKQVCEWYLIVYADAYEWVELPNTLGMALHGDEGVVGTKPYISSGAYINRMSNFCKDCKFNVKKRTGNDACPFNYLYWDFLARHEDKFASNNRMRIAYNNLHNISDDELQEIRESAERFIDSI